MSCKIKVSTYSDRANFGERGIIRSDDPSRVNKFVIKNSRKALIQYIADNIGEDCQTKNIDGKLEITSPITAAVDQKGKIYRRAIIQLEEGSEYELLILAELLKLNT